jgi:hypothetical protein
MKKMLRAIPLVLSLVLLRCGPQIELRRPYVVLQFKEVALVIEGATSPQDVLTLEGDGLSFAQVNKSLFYNAEGSGSFSLRGLSFSYQPPLLSCDCQGWDTSRGAVVVRPDGSLLPANLLPLVAR